MDIYSMILEELYARRCAYSDIYPPYYIASTGCHLLNLVNQEAEFFVDQNGEPENLRLHIIFCAPPGCCVSPYSLMTMADGSYKYAQDVQIGEHVASMDGRINIVNDKVYSGNKKRTHIWPHDLIVSNEHLALTTTGWKYARDLQVGEWLVSAYPKSSIDWLGLWIAEGRFEGKGWTPVLSTTSEDNLERMAILSDKFGCDLIEAGPPAEYRVTHGKITSNKNAAAEFLRWMGYSKDTCSKTKYIPDEIKRIDKSGKLSLIQHMWYGDGTDLQQARYASSSRTLISDTDRILKELGFKTSVYDYDKAVAEIYLKEDTRSNLRKLVQDQMYTSSFPITRIYRTSGVRAGLIDFDTTASHFIANGVVVHNSKTFWINQMMRGRYSILGDTGIDLTLEATLTGAGFVGTTRFNQGEVVKEPGLAEIHARAMVGIEEFSAVTSMFKTSHSGELDNALLLALDSGWVYKRLAAGPIKYRTYVTLHTGSQPARFDLSSGLGRRFYFLEFMPTLKDWKILTKATRGQGQLSASTMRTTQIRAAIRNLNQELRGVKSIDIDPKFYDFMDELQIKHIEELLHKRFLMGLSVMRGLIKDRGHQKKCVLDARFDDTAKKLIEAAHGWKTNVQRGSEFSQVFIILQDCGGSASIPVVRDRLLDYGMDFGQASELIYNMADRLKLIQKHGNSIRLIPEKEKTAEDIV